MKIIRKIMLLFVLCFCISSISIESQAAAALRWSNTGNTKTVLVNTSTTLKTNYKNSKVRWSSSNKKIATVSSKGKVKFLKAGTVTIKCKLKKKPKKYVKCKITVKPKATKFSVSAETPVLAVGNTYKSKLSITPSNGFAEMVWKSSDEKIATVDASGVVKAKKTGHVAIQATLKDGTGRMDSYEVDVIDLSNQGEGGTKFIAHRGFSSMAPENTVKAFELAGDAGFWGAECDVHATKDGVFVINHDAYLSVCGKSNTAAYQIKNMEYAEIEKCTIIKGNNYAKYKNDPKAIKIATLDQYLDVCIEKGLVPVIEIKMAYNVMNDEELEIEAKEESEEELEEALELEEEIQELPEVHTLHGQELQEVGRTTLEKLYDNVKEKMGERPYVFIAFDERCIAKMENLRDIDKEAGDAPNMTVQWLFNKGNYTSNNLSVCMGEKKRGVDASKDVLGLKSISSFQENGCLVNVWTVDDVNTAAKYAFAGVDFITTNKKLW